MCNNFPTEFKIQVTFPIYLIGFMSFISWFLFISFGGIGLAALPLDLIYDFCTRPVKLNQKKLDVLKNKILYDSVILKELAYEVSSMDLQGAKKKNSKFLR
jgi:LMBR1 domain-containing protein 1